MQAPKWLWRSPSLMTQVQTSSPWGQNWLPQVFLWFPHMCVTCTLTGNRKEEEGDKERREQSVLISVWLVWLNTMIFISIYFSTNDNILFFLMDNSVVYIYFIFFIQSPVDRHLGRLCSLAIVSGASVNMDHYYAGLHAVTFVHRHGISRSFK